jgi:hypothetical protein
VRIRDAKYKVVLKGERKCDDDERENEENLQTHTPHKGINDCWGTVMGKNEMKAQRKRVGAARTNA